MSREIDRPLWLNTTYYAASNPPLPEQDPSMPDEIRAHLKNKIMDSKILYNDLSVEEVRMCFDAYVSAQPAMLVLKV